MLQNQSSIHHTLLLTQSEFYLIMLRHVTLCHKKTIPEMNNSTFTTCMMRVWQGGCASNYLHCGNVTHERHGGHKVISLSLRHHLVSCLPVRFLWVVSFPKDTNSRSVLLGNKSVLAGVGNGATAPRPSRNIQHQLQPWPLHKCK